MLTPPDTFRPSLRHVALISGAAFGLLTLLALSGCKEHAADDGHNHGAKPKSAADAHGDSHAHGSEEAHADEVVLTTHAIEQYDIKVEPAQLWVLKPTVIAPARIAFDTESIAHVGSPLRGRVVEINVRLGDTVNAGQSLVVIESPELGEAQADLLQKRIAALTSVPAVELAKVSWERAKNLLEQSQGISLTEVQRREAEYMVAAAAQKAAEAAATASENRLRLLGMNQDAVSTLAKTGEIVPRYTIKAAIDGVVVQREVTLGELVSPDRESLVVIADTRKLWVLADVPEAQLAGIGRGAKAWVTIGPRSSGVGGAAPAPTLEGTVAFISPIVDPVTRTGQVRIEVPATTVGGLTLRPGMFAQVEIVQSDGESDPSPVVAVPDEAIQTVEGGPAIFVPVNGEPNTFAKRAVTIGKPIRGLIPIHDGLVEGEPFVAAGTFILKAELGKAGAAHEH